METAFATKNDDHMIYDCFTFFNELELLELRLHELAEVVDWFVLVEATRTFTNQPKPLYYQENRERFATFADKIIHVVVNDSPDVSDAWAVRRFQRNCTARGLTRCRPDDFILVSDLDEIPRAATVARVSREMRYHSDFLANAVHGILAARPVRDIFQRKGFRRLLRKHHPFVLKFEQDYYCLFLNCRGPNFTYGTRMVFYRDFSCAEEIRNSGYRIVKNGGWHFSWMGGVERMQKKLAACAHREHDQPQFNNPQHLARAMNEGHSLFDEGRQYTSIPLDDTFPRYLFENPEKFSHWLKPVSP
jgi:beta-1,4-mannosyl-glycoprotein beta-1,4-N-acetylglucosaminyltransferase